MTTDIWTAFIKASCTYRDGEPEITTTHLDWFAASSHVTAVPSPDPVTPTKRSSTWTSTTPSTPPSTP